MSLRGGSESGFRHVEPETPSELNHFVFGQMLQAQTDTVKVWFLAVQWVHIAACVENLRLQPLQKN